jgi:hypothetical protein
VSLTNSVVNIEFNWLKLVSPNMPGLTVVGEKS